MLKHILRAKDFDAQERMQASPEPRGSRHQTWLVGGRLGSLLYISIIHCQSVLINKRVLLYLSRPASLH